jgi:tetratricopeptide (TPR) repeat protein
VISTPSAAILLLPGKSELLSSTARTLVALMPESPGAAQSLAWSLLAGRRFAEAEDATRTVLKLDPGNAYALPNLGHLQFRRGAAGDAVATYQQVVQLANEGRLKTGLEHVWLCLGLAQAAAGQAAESRHTLLEAVDKIRGRSGKGRNGTEDEAMVACLLAASGRKDEARALAARLASKATGTIDINYDLARVWAVLGDRKLAIHYLEEAFAAGYDDRYMILVDPPLASVRDDPVIDRLAPYSVHKK